MAIDEALLLTCVADPDGFRPVLRLYAFSRPCLSLGRFQSAAVVDLDACRARGIDVVRRPSGGRAVLHDRCLTYALVAPVDAPPFAGGVRASAARIGRALAAGLTTLGAAVTIAPGQPRSRRSADCFAVAGTGELVGADGGKLAGSAQVRRGRAALQHGTVRLRSALGSVAPFLRAVTGANACASAPAVALDTLCGRPVPFAEAAAAVIAGFRESFRVELALSRCNDDECAVAAALESARYRDDAWTFER
jgi:lipoate-protein ligase A